MKINIIVIFMVCAMVLGALLWNSNRDRNPPLPILEATAPMHYVLLANGYCWVIEDYRMRKEGTYEAIFESENVSECETYLSELTTK